MRSTKPTRAPCAPKLLTIASPIPEAPPEITTGLSFRQGYMALNIGCKPLRMADDRPKSYNIPEEINMPKVWVAGSVNMDIVATAARYPKIRQTGAGKGGFFFPGGQRAKQAVSGAEPRAPTALIGKVGRD